MSSLGIAIDSGRYVRIDSSIGGLYRNVRLRTVSAGQDSAKLEFCSFGKKGPVLRKRVLLEGLSGNGDAPVELRLRVERRGYSLWNIRAGKPGGEYEDIRVRTGMAMWPLILLAVLLLIFGIWFALRFSSQPQQRGNIDSESVPARTDISETDTSMSSSEGSTEVTPDQLLPGNTKTNPEISSAPALQAEKPESPEFSAFPDQTTVIFKPESAALTAAAKGEMDELIDKFPENVGIEIGGHCAIFGTETGRVRLSRARAAAVADYLSGRIPDSVRVEIRGYGGSRPITRDLELQDMNRRVEINVLGDNG